MVTDKKKSKAKAKLKAKAPVKTKKAKAPIKAKVKAPAKPKAKAKPVKTPKAKPVSKAPKKEKAVNHIQLILDKAREAQQDIRNARKDLTGRDAQWRALMLDRASEALKTAYEFVNKLK